MERFIRINKRRYRENVVRVPYDSYEVKNNL